MASAQMQGMLTVMRQMMSHGFMPQFDGEVDPAKLREIIQGAQSRMALEPGVRFEAEKFGDMDAECSIPENAREDAVVIYIHGGGLICGNALSSRGYASMLAGETKLPVWSFSYRLAPEAPYPAAVEDCFAAYQAIVAKAPGKPVFLIGESGGAYLSIVTALKARDEGVQLPAGVIPYSPPIEWCGVLERNHPNNKDFTVTPAGLRSLGKMYCPDAALQTHPYVSPYYADFTGFPPMLLAWDESESLAVDSEYLRDKAIAAGCQVVWKSYPDCFHAFATTGRGTPESAEILKDTGTFINEHI